MKGDFYFLNISFIPVSMKGISQMISGKLQYVNSYVLILKIAIWQGNNSFNILKHYKEFHQKMINTHIYTKQLVKLSKFMQSTYVLTNLNTYL